MSKLELFNITLLNGELKSLLGFHIREISVEIGFIKKRIYINE